MPVSRIVSAVFILGVLAGPVLAMPSFIAPALATDRPHDACLNKAEQRDAVASHRAVPLAHAIKSLHALGRRAEVVRAELCDRGGRLVYVLTLLPRSGKVMRAHVDAGSGEIINTQ